MTTFIYALRDPITEEIRYIGKADNPKTRLVKHLSGARRGISSHKNAWIRNLLASNCLPILEILDEVPDSEWQSWEVAYIQFFTEEGNLLTNGTAGGDGLHHPSEEIRLKLSLSQTGKKMSDLSRKRMSESKSGDKHNFFGREMPEETKIKIGLANKGRKRTPEQCERISASIRGKTHSLETKLRMRDARIKFLAQKSLDLSIQNCASSG